MCQCLQLSYDCAEGQLPPVSPITIPHAPHVLLRPQTTLLLHSLSHKHLDPLAFREVDLRLVFPSPLLTTLRIKLLFAAGFGSSASWLAVQRAKWTWFGNTMGKNYLCRSILVPTFPLVHGHKTSLGEGIYGNSYFSGVSTFSQIREVPGRLISASVESQMSLAQSNTYAKVVYLGVAYSDPLQITMCEQDSIKTFKLNCLILAHPVPAPRPTWRER